MLAFVEENIIVSPQFGVGEDPVNWSPAALLLGMLQA